MSKIIKIGPVELTPEEAQQLYDDNKYIMTYTKVYALRYSDKLRRVTGDCIYTYPRQKGAPGLSLRGRFHALSAKTLNNVLGFNLVTV